MKDFGTLEQEDRESLRWDILAFIASATTRGASDELTLVAARDFHRSASIQSVRETFEFLEGFNLIELEKLATKWIAKITSQGTVVVEGNMQPPPGIAKPV